MPRSVIASGVRASPTRGGTSGHISRDTSPSRSRLRSVTVSIRWLIPSTRRFSSLNRRPGREPRGVRLARGRGRGGSRDPGERRPHGRHLQRDRAGAPAPGAERAARVAGASGQPFSFLVLPGPVLHRGLEGAGLPSPIVGTVLSIQEKFVQGGFDVVTGDVERLAGRKPHALRELLAGAFSGG